MSCDLLTHGTHRARAAGEAEHAGLWQGLAGLWLPQLGPGPTVFDLSGRGKHAALVDPAGTFSWQGDRYGWALVRNGAVSITYLNTGANAVDATAWAWAGRFRVDGVVGSRNTLLAQYDSPAAGACLVVASSRELWWAHALAWAVNLTGFFCTLREWVHVVFQYHAARGTEVWVNGKLQHAHAAAGTFPTVANPFLLLIRNDNYGPYFYGRLGEVAAWHRRLEGDEIARLHRDPWALVRPRRRPFARWRPARTYRVAIGQTYRTGDVAGATFAAGPAIGQTFHSGPTAGQIHA
jgi:hypothetical protein